MLSIYKSEHSKRIAIIRGTDCFLTNGVVYLIEKIRNKIDQSDIDAVLATWMIFNHPSKNITSELYRDTLEKVKKQKCEYSQIKDLDMRYILKDDNGYFMLAPYDDKYSDRQTLLVGSSSGAGKTFWCNEFAKLYQHFYPKQEIYYISVHKAKDDKSLTIKGMVEINAGEMTKSLKKDELPKSLVFLDDCDSNITVDSDSDDEGASRVKKQKNKKTLEAYARENILSSATTLISNSRKYNTSLITVVHKLKQRETHLISVGSDVFVVFPYADYVQIPSFFSSRSNISEKSIRDLLDSSSRMKYEALVVIKEPNVYMYQNKIGIF